MLRPCVGGAWSRHEQPLGQKVAFWTPDEPKGLWPGRFKAVLRVMLSY